jgi:branched-chain amino acid transport system substrate-binding protein
MSSFSRILLAFTALFLLSSCAGSSWPNSTSWSNPNSWFGNSNTVAQNVQKTQTPKPAPPAQAQAPVIPPTQQALPGESLSAVSAAKPIAKVKVAILLPLTGKNAALGQAMLNAGQQAVFDVAASNFELMPRDTGGGEEQAAEAARDATASGAQLLIGPLFAVNIPAVHQAAQNAGIGMLTLSTDTSQAMPGVYVMGFAPDAQVERVVKYAAARGAHRFAALIPNDSYGALVAQAYRAAVAQVQGTLVALEIYDPALHDSAAHAQALAAKRDAIDALFLPEGGSELNLIAGQLTADGFNAQTVHMLGTGLWDVPGLAQQAALLTGGWYAAPDPAARQNFLDTYAVTYGQQPPRLATLAYDATALAAVLAKRGARFDQASITNPNGFAGVDGVFRLRPSGIVDRNLAVLEVTPDGARVADPALTSFAVGSN